MLLAFLVMVLIVGAMAIGVVFGRKPITGSCGGMQALDLECGICGGDQNLCESVPPADLAPDAVEPRPGNRLSVS
jgi:hypothetical protein